MAWKWNCWDSNIELACYATKVPPTFPILTWSSNVEINIYKNAREIRCLLFLKLCVFPGLFILRIKKKKCGMGERYNRCSFRPYVEPRAAVKVDVRQSQLEAEAGKRCLCTVQARVGTEAQHVKPLLAAPTSHSRAPAGLLTAPH